jgi:hypothetical protein
VRSQVSVIIDMFSVVCGLVKGQDTAGNPEDIVGVAAQRLQPRVLQRASAPVHEEPKAMAFEAEQLRMDLSSRCTAKAEALHGCWAVTDWLKKKTKHMSVTSPKRGMFSASISINKKLAP